MIERINIGNLLAGLHRRWLGKSEKARQSRDITDWEVAFDTLLEELIELADEYRGVAEVEALREMVTTGNNRRIMKAVLDVTANHHGVPTHQIIGRGRMRKVVEPRHMAMAIIRDRYGWITVTEMGAFFNRDHSTVVHAVRANRRNVRERSGYRATYKMLRAEAEGAVAQLQERRATSPPAEADGTSEEVSTGKVEASGSVGGRKAKSTRKRVIGKTSPQLPYRISRAVQ